MNDVPQWLRPAAKAERSKAHYVQLGRATVIDALCRASRPSSSAGGDSQDLTWDWVSVNASGLLTNLAISGQAIEGTNDDYMDSLSERVGVRLEEFRDARAGGRGAADCQPRKARNQGDVVTIDDLRELADRGQALCRSLSLTPAAARFVPPHARLHVLACGARWLVDGTA